MPSLRSLGYATIFCNAIQELYHHGDIDRYTRNNACELRSRIERAIKDDDGTELMIILDTVDLEYLQPKTFVVDTCILHQCDVSLALALEYECPVPHEIYLHPFVRKDSAAFYLLQMYGI